MRARRGSHWRRRSATPPLLVCLGHEVYATTRSEAKVAAPASKESGWSCWICWTPATPRPPSSQPSLRLVHQATALSGLTNNAPHVGNSP